MSFRSARRPTLVPVLVAVIAAITALLSAGPSAQGSPADRPDRSSSGNLSRRLAAVLDSGAASSSAIGQAASLPASGSGSSASNARRERARRDQDDRHLVRHAAQRPGCGRLHPLCPRALLEPHRGRPAQPAARGGRRARGRVRRGGDHPVHLAGRRYGHRACCDHERELRLDHQRGRCPAQGGPGALDLCGRRHRGEGRRSLRQLRQVVLRLDARRRRRDVRRPPRTREPLWPDRSGAGPRRHGVRRRRGPRDAAARARPRPRLVAGLPHRLQRRVRLRPGHPRPLQCGREDHRRGPRAMAPTCSAAATAPTGWTTRSGPCGSWSPWRAAPTTDRRASSTTPPRSRRCPAARPNDSLTGGPGNDMLLGNAGADALRHDRLDQRQRHRERRRGHRHRRGRPRRHRDRGLSRARGAASRRSGSCR